ncbi:MAG: Gfo/Idh/MocA family oxidoreductase [Planctomycetota bacterium]
MSLSPEEKEVGQENYHEALGYTRRDFFRGSLAAGIGAAAAGGAMYFGYDANLGDPVRVGVIGTGDEGNILIGALNPNYQQVVAISDIRPSSIHRAIHGDWGGSRPAYTHSLRPGLMQIYGWPSEDEARQHVEVYEDYHELIKNPDVEAVIIALPLHLHAAAAVAAMQAGKHVLTEKLMAHNVAQCKIMGRVAKEKDLLLATGHQRHYSMLYDNAVHLLKWGLLGEVHHIRAQWHRGNLPGRDSWKQPLPGGEIALVDDGRIKQGERFDRIKRELNNFVKKLESPNTSAADLDLLRKQVAQWEAWDRDQTVDAAAFGYEDMQLPDRDRSALEELIRWRLWDRTGGGLMAELGSHQLDAASIFVSALRSDGKKAHPLSVHTVGGRHLFPYDRQAEDHVYCMYEFPGPGYEAGFDVGYKDAFAGVAADAAVPAYDPEQHDNKKIVVTYSSINGNGYGGYGEVVMGTKGTLIIEREKEVMLYKGSSTTTKVGVKDDGGGPTLDTQASGDYAAVSKAATSGPVSRGYREELEHWAWCIRNRDPENQPRCHPEVALADGVIALATKVAQRNANAGKGGYLKFEEDWYNIDHDATPDGSEISVEMQNLNA